MSFRSTANGKGFVIEYMGTSDFTADQLLEAARAHSRPEPEEAVYLAYSILGDGPVLANDVKRLARKGGVAERTLRRAKEVLRITSKRRGFGKSSKFWWTLPEHNAILDGLREQDLDQLMDRLCHGQPRDGSWPDDSGGTPPDSKKGRKRKDKPTDDDSGSAPMPDGE